MALLGRRRSAAVLFSSSVTPSCALSATAPPGAQVFFGGSLAALRKVFFGPFAGDEHHQVRPSLGLPFLLCETEHPNLTYYLYSDLI